jgi:hypothetical protein
MLENLKEPPKAFQYTKRNDLFDNQNFITIIAVKRKFLGTTPWNNRLPNDALTSSPDFLFQFTGGATNLKRRDPKP